MIECKNILIGWTVKAVSNRYYRFNREILQCITFCSPMVTKISWPFPTVLSLSTLFFLFVVFTRPINATENVIVVARRPASVCPYAMHIRMFSWTMLVCSCNAKLTECASLRQSYFNEVVHASSCFIKQQTEETSTTKVIWYNFHDTNASVLHSCYAGNELYQYRNTHVCILWLSTVWSFALKFCPFALHCHTYEWYSLILPCLLLCYSVSLKFKTVGISFFSPAELLNSILIVPPRQS